MSLSKECVCMYRCEQLCGKNAYELKEKGKQHSSVHVQGCNLHCLGFQILPPAVLSVMLQVVTTLCVVAS